MFMKILKYDNENLIIINKSKFIGIVKKVFTYEEANNLLENIKKEY